MGGQMDIYPGMYLQEYPGHSRNGQARDAHCQGCFGGGWHGHPCAQERDAWWQMDPSGEIGEQRRREATASGGSAAFDDASAYRFAWCVVCPRRRNGKKCQCEEPCLSMESRVPRCEYGPQLRDGECAK